MIDHRCGLRKNNNLERWSGTIFKEEVLASNQEISKEMFRFVFEVKVKCLRSD